MSSHVKSFLLLAAFAGTSFLTACGDRQDQPNAASVAHDDDDGHGHEAADDHDDEVVRLTPQQLERAGVVIKPLQGGTITTHLMLPAEVGLNQDAVVHVTPRVPGIVTSVIGYLGAEVAEGALLAVIESPELGEAKIVYLQAIQTRGISESELARQRTISENTARLLDLLRDEPSFDSVQSAIANLRIGENKGRLLSAYAKMKAAGANYARQRGLHESSLSTEANLLAAQETFNISRAEYFAAYEDIEFTYRLRLHDAERSDRIASSSVDNAQRRLHLFGLSDDQISAITTEPDADVARYELRAPIGGRLVAKHITPGEKVTGESSVYTIADLQTVWLNISVYSEYKDQIREGQRVTVHAGERATTGVVEFVSPVVSESTRTVAARVVIQNNDGAWKPGEFVTAGVETGQAPADRVVPLDAVQTFEGAEVVFVQDGEVIRPTKVLLGRRNADSVELLGDDIAIGTPIVIRNSFLMKAELGKSAAGHDH